MTGRAWALFATVSLLWGVPYLFTGVALRDGLPPTTIVAARVVLGGLVLLPLALPSGLVGLVRTRWRALAILSAVQVVVPFLLIAVGQQTVSSALTGILIATEPLFVVLLARLSGTAPRLTPTARVGLVVGFLGVVTLLGLRGGGAGAGLVLTAAACYGLGALLVDSRFPGVPNLVVAAAVLLLACPPLLAVALAGGPLPRATAPALLAVLALGVVCTGGGFCAYYALIEVAGPARATVTAYVAPVVAAVAGVLLLDEDVTARSLVGVALILLGAVAATRGPAVAGAVQP